MRFSIFAIAIIAAVIALSFYAYAFTYSFQDELPTGLVVDEHSHEPITPTIETYKITYIKNLKGNTIARIKNNELQYLHRDYLGSLRMITDKDGNVVSKMDYDPFGLSSKGEEFAFSKKANDLGENLYDFGARFYDPETGRFLSLDPVGASNDNLNLYIYAKNNPLKYIDPSGKTARNTQYNYVVYDKLDKLSGGFVNKIIQAALKLNIKTSKENLRDVMKNSKTIFITPPNKKVLDKMGDVDAVLLKKSAFDDFGIPKFMKDKADNIIILRTSALQKDGKVNREKIITDLVHELRHLLGEDHEPETLKEFNRRVLDNIEFIIRNTHDQEFENLLKKKIYYNLHLYKVLFEAKPGMMLYKIIFNFNEEKPETTTIDTIFTNNKYDSTSDW